MLRQVEGRAFAKVNLGLRILDRRPDGFHELRTVFQTISLADRLRVGYEPARKTTVALRCGRPELENEDNLVWRAAEGLLGLDNRWRGKVSLDLDKRIPAGAGLGGGSSDAAATLLALARLLEPAPAPEQLQAAAEKLGSDVPFFLLGGRAVGIGRGEEIYPLPEQPRRWMFLLCPRLHVSTVEAYRALAESRGGGLTPDRKRFIVSSFCSGIRVPGPSGTNDTAEAPVNDFEDVIFRRFPELLESKKKLLSSGAEFALLSGSGSALFGVFPSRQAAVDARKRFGDFDGESFVVRTVNRREHGNVWGG